VALIVSCGALLVQGQSGARRYQNGLGGKKEWGGPAHRWGHLEAAFSRTRELLVYAHAVVTKHGGAGALEFRKAVVYQRAARHAHRKGAFGLAIQLTREARRWAREAVVVNRLALPPTFVLEQPGELVPVAPPGTPPPAGYGAPAPHELSSAFSQAERGVPAQEQLLGGWGQVELAPVELAVPPAPPPVAPAPTYVVPGAASAATGGRR
jgi:hypothetical protein